MLIDKLNSEEKDKNFPPFADGYFFRAHLH